MVCALCWCPSQSNWPKSPCLLWEAKKVKGCTGVSESAAWSASFAGPVEGTGAYTGSVKSFGPKGYGFINLPDGTELFFNVKDCVGSKPVAGDTVKFDMAESDTKPGQMQARGGYFVNRMIG